MTEPSRNALLTGGGTGIGLATAVLLNREGFDLTIVGRRGDVLAGAARDIAAQGGGPPVAVTTADLRDAAAADAVVDEHVGRFGGIGGLVAGAGSYGPLRFPDLDVEVWDATIDVHVRSVVVSAAAAARQMTGAGSGRIVLISSVNGFQSEPETMHYSAAKAAITSIARSIAVDLAGTGVIVNAVAPGWVTTPMTVDYLADATPDSLRRLNTLGRAGRPEEIAEVIRFLLVDAPEFLTGSTLTVDGGQTALAPLP